MYKVVALAMLSTMFASGVAAAEVKVDVHEAQRRVDVTVDGKPFTSYIWPTSLKKPVLYPLVLSDGVTVTRGFPLEPRAGERQDHPHHAGLWFNYGNVNGFDFWNNSDAITGDRVPHMARIGHRLLALLGKGEHAVGQIAPLGQFAMLLVGFPGRFHRSRSLDNPDPEVSPLGIEPPARLPVPACDTLEKWLFSGISRRGASAARRSGADGIGLKLRGFTGFDRVSADKWPRIGQASE